jgi:hypothetical protein
MDLEKVMDVVAVSDDLTADKKQELKIWYQNFIAQMNRQGIQKTGHVQESEELITELLYLHSTLLNVMKYVDYVSAFKTVEPLIKEFREKTDKKKSNVVELCLSALYIKMLMRLKGMSITKETEQALQLFSALMALLSGYYQKMKNGELGTDLN